MKRESGSEVKMPARIVLTNGMKTLVDAEDVARLSQYRWRAFRHHGRLYVMRTIPSTPYVYLHRMVLEAQSGQIVDHINLNGLDNRKENLRFVNGTLSNINQEKGNKRGGGASRYKGVYPKWGNWVAAVRINRKGHHLGSFATEEDAARRYDAVVRYLFGSQVATNFPGSETLSIEEAKRSNRLRRKGVATRLGEKCAK